jgi:hypothetical protein
MLLRAERLQATGDASHRSASVRSLKLEGWSRIAEAADSLVSVSLSK